MSQLQEEAQYQQKIPTILLVEDDLDLIEMFEILLGTETPYRLVCMRSAAEMLQRIEEVKALQPVLLILDYLLPGMTGLDLYDALQRVEELAELPTIIVTATPRPQIVRYVDQRKVYICYKPFDINAFLTMIEHLIRERS